MHKLCQYCFNDVIRKNRNNYVTLLLECVKVESLEEPFSRIPPQSDVPILPHHQLISIRAKVQKARFDKTRKSRSGAGKSQMDQVQRAMQRCDFSPITSPNATPRMKSFAKQFLRKRSTNTKSAVNLRVERQSSIQANCYLSPDPPAAHTRSCTPNAEPPETFRAKTPQRTRRDRNSRSKSRNEAT